METAKQWQTVILNDYHSINRHNLILHHAVQYIALAGRYLIPQQKDDSNTNMHWNERESNFLGNIIQSGNRARVGINAMDLELQILDSSWKILSYYPLVGQTKNDGFLFLKEALERMKVNTENLKDDLHYALPYYQTDNGKSFEAGDKHVFGELAKHRNNANLILNNYAKKFANTSDIKVWPHHFDTGCLVPIKLSETGEMIKTMGLGFSINDAYVDQPYFYVTHWMATGNADYSSLKPLDGEGKWNRKDWTGAILELSSIVNKQSAEEQTNVVMQFFDLAIAATLDLLDEPNKPHQ